jgi:hypothetical protein
MEGVFGRVGVFASVLVVCCSFVVCGALVLAVPAGAVGVGARQIGASECHGHPGECEAGGQLFEPLGVAVNNVSSSSSFGLLYVVDRGNWRVDGFAAVSGMFQLAWGSGVADGASELQSCTTSCRKGLREEKPQPVTGGISYGNGVAVDNNPPSSSLGDVYVVSEGTVRVEKFDPEGKFLLTFGGGVNKKGGNVCTKTEECQQGTVGSADGQFSGVSSIAVGPGGLVYVGDRARVQVFEASGAWKETISLAGLSSTGIVEGLAVDSSGDVFVGDGEVAGVREFRLVAGKWTEIPCKPDETSTSIASIAVDGLGDLYVGDTSGGSNSGFHVLKYNASCKPVGSFGSNTVRCGWNELIKGKLFQREPCGHNGMVFSEASGSPELYVSESYEERPEFTGEPSTIHSSVWVLPVPPPGPAIVEESAKPGPRGSVSLEATINPEGNETLYYFEYVSDTDFTKMVGGKKCEWSCVSRTPTGVIPGSLEDRLVSSRVTGLAVSSTYHYRVVASSEEEGKTFTATGPGQTFETLPSAEIEAEYATNIASTSATVDANVNPLGSSTEYSFEYGTGAAYEHVVSGDAGKGTTSILVSRHLQGLSPAVTYHYRIVLHNELGTVEGLDHTFTTQAPSGVVGLPDGRVWELASPADKKGALMEPTYLGAGNQLQAASDGSGVTYRTMGPHVGEDPQGKIIWSQVLSMRERLGSWRSTDLTLPDRLPENGAPAYEISFTSPEYHLFSEDLSLAAVEPQKSGTPLLSPEATERTVYLRNDPVCANRPVACYTPLATANNTPAETIFGGKETGGSAADAEQMHFVTATPDLSHVVLESPFALTAQANDNYFPGRDQWNLYEWSAGRLRLVNILPNGEATHGVSPNTRLADGGAAVVPSAVIPSAVSSDGSRIAWDVGVPYGGNDSEWGLFVRDMVLEKTVQVGGPHAVFQWMSSDGSRVFFLENGDLHLCVVGTNTATGKLECAPSDLTAVHGAPANGEAGAGVQEIVSDVSRDGSYVYFVATSVLAGLNGPVSGAENLYLVHSTGSEWSTTYIATLSHEDEKNWKQSDLAARGGHNSDLSQVTSRVSPSGRYLAFMSNRSLTGYDNTDAVSGQPDEEIYLYHAPLQPGSEPGKLVCASCDPTGARPVGVLDQIDVHGGAGTLLIDREGVWSSRGAVHDHWLAASIPNWDPIGSANGSQYQPRYLSDIGRLFFDSPDPLVPQATNGIEDVYEYEPLGTGGETGCAASSPTFSERTNGCVSLVSPGTSNSESAFYDASENGGDAFFITLSKLVTADYDNAYDVYDAHVCSNAVPCLAEPTRPPSCTTEASCRPSPTPQPEIFGPAPSATFSGTGNLNPKPIIKPRCKIRAKKRCASHKRHKNTKAHKQHAVKANRRHHA